MEYCDEGTLEEVSRLGLQEHVIRLYSKQITTAINVLHEHGIVHRDIKGLRLYEGILYLLNEREDSNLIFNYCFALFATGANIFLTSSGLIKLGDFGCSVKLRNNTQTMPGEVNSTLGTAGTQSQSYMPHLVEAFHFFSLLQQIVSGNLHSWVIVVS